MTIERAGSQLRYGSSVLDLQQAPNVTAAVEAVRSAWSRARLRYGPQWDDRLPFRWKITSYLLLMFAVQEICFLFLRRWRLLYLGLRVLAVMAWIGGAWWLHSVYLS